MSNCQRLEIIEGEKKSCVNVDDLRRLKADLVFYGVTQKEVARRAGVSSQMVWYVISGRKVSRRILCMIKQILQERAAKDLNL